MLTHADNPANATVFSESIQGASGNAEPGSVGTILFTREHVADGASAALGLVMSHIVTHELNAAISWYR